METSARRSLATVAAAVLAATLAGGAAPAAAQTSSEPGSPPGDSLRQRLQSVARVAEDLAGHFRQMETSVSENPELREEAGWASAEAIAWSAELASLVGSVAERASALEAHLREVSGAGELASRQGMGGRLDALRRDLAQVTAALESMRAKVREMQDVVHGRGGHGHGGGGHDHGGGHDGAGPGEDHDHER